MAENLQCSGSELERRIAEGTHRLVFLAIQNSKLERRTAIGQRLRLSMSNEIDRIQSNNCRLVLDDERRLKQMALENVRRGIL
jgi:hypothetical protein